MMILALTLLGALISIHGGVEGFSCAPPEFRGTTPCEVGRISVLIRGVKNHNYTYQFLDYLYGDSYDFYTLFYTIKRSQNVAKVDS